MSNELFLFFLATLPVAIIIAYLYKKDTEKEPKKLLAYLFLGGIMSTILTLVLTGILDSMFPFFKVENEPTGVFELIIYVFVGVALIEEFSKWVFVYNIGYKSKEFDHPYDILLYSGVVALGFAFFENLFYVYEGGIQTAILRSLTAVPGHACDGIFMGYFLSLAKAQELSGNQSNAKKYILLSIVVPLLLHGAYDFFLMCNLGIIVFGFIVVLIGQFIFTIIQINKISKINISKPKPEVEILNQTINYCPNCGTQANGNFCSTCGTKLK